MSSLAYAFSGSFERLFAAQALWVWPLRNQASPVTLYPRVGSVDHQLLLLSLF